MKRRNVSTSSQQQQREFLRLYNFFVHEKGMDPNEAAAETIKMMKKRQTSVSRIQATFRGW